MIVDAITTASGIHGFVVVAGATVGSVSVVIVRLVRGAGPSRARRSASRSKHRSTSAWASRSGWSRLCSRAVRSAAMVHAASRRGSGALASTDKPRRGVIGDDLAEQVRVVQVLRPQRDRAADQQQPAAIVVRVAEERIDEVVGGDAQRVEECLVRRARRERVGKSPAAVGRVEEQHVLLRREVAVVRAR